MGKIYRDERNKENKRFTGMEAMEGIKEILINLKCPFERRR